MRRILGFLIVDRRQISIATLVVNGQRRALVVGGGIVSVEGRSDHWRISWEIQTQGHLRGLFGLSCCFLWNGQNRHVAHVSLTRAVDLGRHQTLSGRVDHVVLVVHHERSVSGVNVLESIGRFQGKKAVTRYRHVQRVG